MAAPVPDGTVDFMTSAWRSDAGIASHDRVDGAEVGVARVGRRRSDGDEQQPRVLERVAELGREVQALAVAADELREARLVDRDLARAQPLDLLRVDVDAAHLGPELGEAGGGDEADVAGADDADRFALGAHGGGG